MAQSGIIHGVAQEKQCRIQWDDCPRQQFPNKFPRFPHVLTPFILPNLNVGLGLAVMVCDCSLGAVYNELVGYIECDAIEYCGSYDQYVRIYDACIDCFTPESKGIEVIDSNEDFNDIRFRYRRDTCENTENVVYYECEYISQYRCMDGYYGLPEFVDNYDDEDEYGVNSMTMAPCKECPTLNGWWTYSEQTPYHSGDYDYYTDITDCYAPSGVTYSDSKGRYAFTSDCHYSK